MSTGLTREKVVELYFMEHRAKLIDIAAFLDRYDRGATGGEDFRITALKDAARLLTDGKPDRARRILEQLSDHTIEPIASAVGLKGAYGAPPPRTKI